MNSCKIICSVDTQKPFINLSNDLSRLKLHENKIFRVALYSVYRWMENLNDLVKEHLVVVKRIQVLL